MENITWRTDRHEDRLEIRKRVENEFAGNWSAARKLSSHVRKGERMLSRGRKAQIVPCFGSAEFVTCLWIACAVLTLVASQQHFYVHGRYGKRQEPRAASFFVSGSRYGRSDIVGKNEKSKIVEIEPRMDRFFPGSRYGKRVPLQYQSASSLNRFTAVLDYMDRDNNDILDNGMSISEDNPLRGSEEDPQVLP